MDKKRPYYIGLDCGTNSVGWAVTDGTYRLLKGTHRIKSENGTKTKKQTLWGFRLFDEADTAAERRIHRSARRRGERAKTRLKLLRLLFRDEIAKVDPEFYQRLKESFYYEEDKRLQKNSKNTLFDDSSFTDKDFHKKYPTIWHLRQAIIKADESESFDIRLYFLAIQHILKHRGHFLLNGNIGSSGINFEELFEDFREEAERVGYNIAEIPGEIESILTKKASKIDKKKELKEILYIEDDALDEDAPKGQLELAGLLVGSKVDLKKIFASEDDDKFSYSFSEGVFEDKLPEIEQTIGSDNLDLIFAAKNIYDYVILHNLLGSHKMISDAMVANYIQHEDDLRKLKKVLKPHQNIYRQLFKTELYDEKSPSYNAYIGKAYTEDKSERRASKNISQENFNKYLHKLLEKIKLNTSPELLPVVDELLDRTDTSEKSTSPLLLPKQRGQAKGAIPMQLHANELKIILEKLQRDFPSFAEEVPNESNDYNTKAKKINKIHSFRIPYYCGPLVSKKKSDFSWADEEISELVYPWNFDQLVNKDGRAKNFIRRMTNECTYLFGEDVLPKCSLTYQKYMVLNELNNLKTNGYRIDNKLKQQIFERGYKNGEIKGNITLRKLEKWCKENGFITNDDELSGTSEVKILPKYQSYQDFSRFLGVDFEKKYPLAKLEKVIELITILGDEKSMLEKNIKEELVCDDKSAKNLSKLSYKDWGRMSARFLNAITVNNCTILDWLWEDNKNLMELLGQEVGFGKVVDEYNEAKRPKSKKISYLDIEKLYCSPAVKRSVWQTIKIVNELVKDLGHAPAKIFLEVTRGEDEKSKGKYTLARKKDLETKLKAVKTDDAKAILKELDGYEDRSLQSKKLFLYFSQMGKCAYSGEPINIEELNNSQLYDIDHIYPRSRTKDDSITRNLVLVKANLNREKTNIYPISDSIRSKMRSIWSVWYRTGLITKEKYERLTRITPLTNDELGGFIARQLVETSQSVKAIRDLLKRAYPDTKIVMVKAGQVSEFRHLMGGDKKDQNGNVYEQGRYEFIKVRDINDLHHAKDAYLNIVVGNVMNETFTDNPYEWIKRRDGKDYSIRPERIFRNSQKYTKANGEETIYPEVKGWNYADSIRTISNVMKRNDVIWTRMNYIESKEISDLQLVGKGKNSDGLLKIKQQKRLDPKKYGGYNSLKGAHFSLIECKDKKGNTQRRIIQIPIIAKDNIEKYVIENYSSAKVILPVIKYKSLIKINGCPLHLAGKTSTGLVLYIGKQFLLDIDFNRYVKLVQKFVDKNKVAKNNYKIDELKDGVNSSDNILLMNQICSRLSILSSVPSFGDKISEIKKRNELNFRELDLKTQCEVISGMIKAIKCNAETGDISILVPKSSHFGKPTMPEDILPRYDSAVLINQSPTGLYEEIINLKTVHPKISKQDKK
jgi:CRISPR-associated endonuclease Csn1